MIHEENMQTISSPKCVGILWTRSLVQRLLARMAPGELPREVLAVVSKNSFSVTAAAEIGGLVRGTRVHLLPRRARQKRTGVPLRAAF